MKKATFSGIRSILCNVLFAALLLGLSGCASGTAESGNTEEPAAVASEAPQTVTVEDRETTKPAVSAPAEEAEERQPAVNSVAQAAELVSAQIQQG